MLFLFHSSVAALYFYALWYDQQYVDLPFPSEEIAAMPFKARALFFTIWCLILQAVYFTIALLNDVIGTNETAPKNPPFIRKIKDYLFSLTFTIAIYVGAAFWALYYVNKDLIFPDYIEERFPIWINHTAHTLIVPFITIELFLSKRNYPSRNLGVTTILLFSFAYVSYIHAVYFSTGIWAYPLLDVLSWPMKTLYFICSTVLGVSIYVLGEKLNSLSSLDNTVIYKNIVRKIQ